MTPIKIGADKRNSRIALTAVILFLLLDSMAIALNFWMSWKIEESAIAINLAGRQRMLSQRMVKVLLALDKGQRGGEPLHAGLEELRVTFRLFDDTLLGFDKGHATRGGANEVLFLPAVTSERARPYIDQAAALWAPYRTHIQRVLAEGPVVSRGSLHKAIDYAERHNLNLLALMNSLTTELEATARREARQIRLFQSTAFVLALLNFIWAFVLYSRRIREFSHSHNLLDEIINKVSACVLVMDADDVILKANHVAENLFGYDGDELVRQQIGVLLHGVDHHLVGKRKDGSTFMASIERSVTVLDQQELHIATVLDVTQQRMTEEHLSSLAYHDLLTRLPNRLLFDDRLQVEIAYALRRNLQLAVLFIDLDNFKPVNDHHGHEVGDLLLQDVAIRLKRSLRDCDTVSRRGGDEFTIILSDIGSIENAEKVANTILSQLAMPFHIHDHVIHIGASIGISLYPRDGSEAGLLLGRADEAMYCAKQSGRNRYCFYSGDRQTG